jgi:hypothetical protein
VTAVLDPVRRRLAGDYVVDETGLDLDVARVVAPLLTTGWRITVTGADRLPAAGGALLVYNRLVGRAGHRVAGAARRRRLRARPTAAGAPPAVLAAAAEVGAAAFAVRVTAGPRPLQWRVEVL